MHTKKTNNINKLMQISYHSALTKIQKLQNLKKKKKKTFFCIDRYCPKLASTAGIFSGTKLGVICTGLLVGTVYTDRYGTESTPFVHVAQKKVFIFIFLIIFFIQDRISTLA